MTRVAAIIGAFLVVAGIFIFALILQRKVQTRHQTVEVGVTIGCDAVRTASHKIIRIGVRVAAEFREHIGPAFHVVQHAIVTAIIERAVVTHFYTGEGQTRPGLVIRPFSVISLNVVLPLGVAGHHVVDLRLTLETQTHVGLVAIFRGVIREVVQAVYFSVQV